MKSFFLCLAILALTIPSNDIHYYKQAVQLILSSKEFKEYKVSEKDCHISSEVIAFSNFEGFYREELKSNAVLDINAPEVVEIKSDLLKLNIR